MNFTDETCDRFRFVLDMTGDGKFTISDLLALATATFHLPAKLVMELMSRVPVIERFFEMDCGTGEHTGGAIFSAVIWWMAWHYRPNAFRKKPSRLM